MATRNNPDALEVAAKAVWQSPGTGDDMPPTAIHIKRSTCVRSLWKPLRTVVVIQPCEISGQAIAGALLTELAERHSAGGYRD